MQPLYAVPAFAADGVQTKRIQAFPAREVSGGVMKLAASFVVDMAT